MTPSVARHRVRVGDVDLSYLAAGPDDGHAIALLHGIPASAELWRGVLERVGAAGRRVVAPDLLGYGETRVESGHGHALTDSAAVIAAWIARDLGGSAWVVGHDLGGAVAQALVVHHRDVVDRLTLGDTVLGDNWPVPSVRAMQLLARTGVYPRMAAARLMPNPYANAELRRAFADPTRLTAAARARVFWDGKVTDPRGRAAFAMHLAALDNRFTTDLVPALAEVAVPTLLLWADRDPFQPWSTTGVALRNALPDPDVRIVADAGHFVPLEQPDAYAEALLAWGYA